MQNELGDGLHLRFPFSATVVTLGSHNFSDSLCFSGGWFAGSLFSVSTSPSALGFFFALHFKEGLTPCLGPLPEICQRYPFHYSVYEPGDEEKEKECSVIKPQC